MVLMEDGIGWGVPSGAKDNRDTKGKMLVALHALNSAAWEDPDCSTEQMLEELREYD